MSPNSTQRGSSHLLQVDGYVMPSIAVAPSTLFPPLLSSIASVPLRTSLARNSPPTLYVGTSLAGGSWDRDLRGVSLDCIAICLVQSLTQGTTLSKWRVDTMGPFPVNWRERARTMNV